MTEPGDGTAASSPPGQPRQRIFGSGFAYAALGADVHVFQDRGPVYALTAYTAPVEEDVRRLRAQPSRLLDARFRTVPFTGRDRELAGLARWRDRPDASAAVRWLHAPGGQGKTRLADEFSRRSAEAGWSVVHAVGHDAVHRSSGRHRDLRVPEDAPGVLVVVDYADRWPLSHLTWLFSNALLRQPVLTRVLLLARTTDGWPPLRAALSRTRAATDERRLEPLPSGPGARRRMFTVARDAFAAAYGVTDPARLIPPGGLDHPDFGLTLAVHMAALVAVDTAVHGGRPPGDMAGLSAHLLDRESRHWTQLYAGRAEGRAFATVPDVMARAVFASVLTGAVGHQEGVEVLRRLEPGGEPQRTLADHAVCYPPAVPDAATVLEPLCPDRLAEDFLALSLPGHGLAAFAADPWAVTAASALFGAGDGPVPGSAARAVTFLTAATERWPHVGTRCLYPLLRAVPRLAVEAGAAALAALAALPGLDPAVLEAVEPHLPPGGHTDLDTAVAAFTRRFTAHRLEVEDDPYRRAHLHAVLAWRLLNAGRHRESAATGREAVRHCRDLLRSAAPPAGARPLLAASLTHLGIAYVHLKRYAEALPHQEEAAVLFRGLVEDRPFPAPEAPEAAGAARVAGTVAGLGYGLLLPLDPAALGHLPSFAGALDNLGSTLAELGRPEEGLLRAREGLAIRQLLVRSAPGPHRGDLAMSWHNLGARLSELGRPEESLRATEEAVALRRVLAAEDPAVHLPDLAMSSHNRGHALAALERRDEAVSAGREAVAAGRRAARAHPGHLRLLAASLHTLGSHLSRAGQDAEALSVTEEAVTVRRRLAEAAPDVHLPDLIDSLNNLQLLLGGSDRPEDALRAATEAAEAARRLGLPDLLAHAGPVLTALRWRSVRLGRLGRDRKARRAARETLEVRRRLAAADFAAHAPGLAEALVTHGNALAAEGPSREACEAGREAVRIYRRLAAADPDAYDGLLAGAMDNLAVDLAGLGEWRAALDLTGRAVALYRRPAASGVGEPDLMAALTNYGSFLYRAGRTRQALAAVEEAVTIGRRLARTDPAADPSRLAAARSLHGRLLSETGTEHAP